LFSVYSVLEKEEDKYLMKHAVSEKFILNIFKNGLDIVNY
jgi:hypothetical protein